MENMGSWKNETAVERFSRTVGNSKLDRCQQKPTDLLYGVW